MLEIRLEERELFDERTSEFVTLKPVTLKLEHSLLSISKWEAKTHKRFVASKTETDDRTYAETIEYVKCMTLNKDVPDIVYDTLGREHIDKINEYISDSMSATTFKNNEVQKSARNGEAVSSELVYYWMTAFNIPFECEKWHFNRLMTLINICSIKNKPPKKMSKGATMKNNAALNAARRKAHHSKG